jgi:hypothetical protein
MIPIRPLSRPQKPLQQGSCRRRNQCAGTRLAGQRLGKADALVACSTAIRFFGMNRKDSMKKSGA